VDRRKVEHVESHRGDVGKSPFHVTERAVAAGLAGGSRKQLVPRAESRAHGIDQNLELTRVRDVFALIRISVNQLDELPGNYLRSRDRGGQQRLRVLLQGGRICTLCPACSGFDKLRANFQLRSDVLARRHALGELQAPGQEPVDPCLERIDVSTELGHGELRPPPVVPERAHTLLGPRGSCMVPVAHDTGESVMAVGENVGLDGHLLSQGAVAGKPPAIDLRRNCFDDHAAPAVQKRRLRSGGLDGRAAEPPFDRSASHQQIVAICIRGTDAAGAQALPE